LDLLYPAHVGLDQDRAPALGAYLVGDTLGGASVIEPVDRYIGTRRGKFARHRAADPLLRPRDQNDLASQLHISDSFDPDLDRDFPANFDDRINGKPEVRGMQGLQISPGRACAVLPFPPRLCENRCVPARPSTPRPNSTSVLPAILST
jgi:hypothetical protein